VCYDSFVSLTPTTYVRQPVSFTVVSGSLPPGLLLASHSGAITGTALGSGPYVATISVAYPDGRCQIIIMKFCIKGPCPISYCYGPDYYTGFDWKHHHSRKYPCLRPSAITHSDDNHENSDYSDHDDHISDDSSHSQDHDHHHHNDNDNHGFDNQDNNESDDSDNDDKHRYNDCGCDDDYDWDWDDYDCCKPKCIICPQYLIACPTYCQPPMYQCTVRPQTCTSCARVVCLRNLVIVYDNRNYTDSSVPLCAYP